MNGYSTYFYFNGGGSESALWREADGRRAGSGQAKGTTSLTEVLGGGLEGRVVLGFLVGFLEALLGALRLTPVACRQYHLGYTQACILSHKRI